MALSNGNISNTNKLKRISTNRIGQKWQDQSGLNNNGTAIFYPTVCFFNNSESMYTIKSQSLYKTLNGGSVWELVSTPSWSTPQSIASSSNGSIVYFAGQVMSSYYSSNGGSTIATANISTSNSPGYTSVACSDSGQYAYLGGINFSPGTTNNSGLFYTNNYGTSWSSVTNSVTQTPNSSFTGWQTVTCSSSGQYAMAVCDSSGLGTGIFKTSNYGTTWTNSNAPGTWTHARLISYGTDRTSLVSMSKDASIVYATDRNYLYKSTDFGTTWGTVTGGTAIAMGGVSCSADGRNVVFSSGSVTGSSASNSGYYFSNNYGTSWYFTSYTVLNINPVLGSTDLAGITARSRIKFSNDAKKTAVYGFGWVLGGTAFDYIKLSNYV